MGLFTSDKKKKNPAEDAEHFLDEYFREELRNRGRWYFENIIKENASVFKTDLKSTITEINANLKSHVTSQLDSALTQLNAQLQAHVTEQLDAQFVEYSKTMKQAQDAALHTMTENAESLQKQYQDLRTMLQSNITDQKTTLTNIFEENKVRIADMQKSQDLALDALNSSTKALQEQHEMIQQTFQQTVAKQEDLLVNQFEQNMSKVVEHYLLSALGDQYDFKAQLPAIIEQMEANKQALIDDIKL